MKWKNSIVFAVIIFFNISAFSQDVSGTIVRVQDGDSFHLHTSDSTYTVRLNGIDCPEINQPFGEDARNFLRQYLSDSVIISLKTVDKYGRSISDVFYKDTLLNFLLVQNGLAWHYKKYSSDTILSNAEAQAKNLRLGLWKGENIVAPWDWRSGNYDQEKFIQNNEAKVFICVGGENTLFHSSSHCKDLSNCNSTVILVFPSEAISAYHKEKCAACFKSK